MNVRQPTELSYPSLILSKLQKWWYKKVVINNKEYTLSTATLWNVPSRFPVRYNPIDWNSSRHFCSRSAPFFRSKSTSARALLKVTGNPDFSPQCLRINRQTRQDAWVTSPEITPGTHHAQRTQYGKRFTCWSHLLKKRDLRIPP